MKKLLGCLLLFGALLTTGCHKDNDDSYEQDIRNNGEKKTYVVISDLHLGDDRSQQQHYGTTVVSLDTIVAFLDYLLNDSTWDELVVAGDLFDEWAIPSNIQTLADLNGNILTEQQFVAAIVQANAPFFDKLRQLKNAGHKLVYLVGNHDMQVSAEDLETILPNLFEYHGHEGVGSYAPNNLLLIDHGHRYDLFNAPYKGKQVVDSIGAGSILPPGFFVCRNNTDHRMGGKSLAPLNANLDTKEDGSMMYNLAWDIIESVVSLRNVATGTDGMTRTYSPADYRGSDARLFPGIDQSDGLYGWDSRCRDNETLYTPSIAEAIMCAEIPSALDIIGEEVLASGNTRARVLVFGHSHRAAFTTKQSPAQGKTIYINTGCWIDGNKDIVDNNRCFAVITLDDLQCTASLKQFTLDGGLPKVDILKNDSIYL